MSSFLATIPFITPKYKNCKSLTLHFPDSFCLLFENLNGHRGFLDLGFSDSIGSLPVPVVSCKELSDCEVVSDVSGFEQCPWQPLYLDGWVTMFTIAEELLCADILDDVTSGNTVLGAIGDEGDSDEELVSLALSNRQESCLDTSREILDRSDFVTISSGSSTNGAMIDLPSRSQNHS